MKNLMELIEKRSAQLTTKTRSSFNTNDQLIDILLNKTIERSDVINIILSKRIEMLGLDVEKMTDDEFMKLYKTSKNGLDTSVSDSNNNSSFSYNQKYDQYKLIKKGSTLSIKKIDDVK